MLGSLLALTLAQSVCTAPPGTTELLNGDQRFVLIGEMHGTSETPAAFAQIVCEAALRGPVTVALEMSEAMQPNLDAFLIAHSDAAALSPLEGTPFLDPTMTDGRTSQAMLEMMQSLRRLKAEGRDIAIHAFQPDSTGGGQLPQAYYELEMGRLLARAAINRPQAKVFALVGNIHASKITNPRLGLPAAAHLPADETVSLYVVQQGGEAWNCMQVCGANPLGMGYDADARGVIMGAKGDGAYDGLLALGPTTASPPVAAEGSPYPSRSSE